MKLMQGIFELITSPSGFFSLLALAVLSVLSWHLGVAWASAAAAAWAAFFAVIPAALGYFEHKETLVQMQQPPPPAPPILPSPIPDVPTATATVTVSTPLDKNLPPRGIL